MNKCRLCVQPGVRKSTQQAYTALYRNRKMKIQTYSENTQQCLEKRFKCWQQIRTLHKKIEQSYDKCLPVLEARHQSYVLNCL
jgi:hypothetical protein